MISRMLKKNPQENHTGTTVVESGKSGFREAYKHATGGWYGGLRESFPEGASQFPGHTIRSFVVVGLHG